VHAVHQTQAVADVALADRPINLRCDVDKVATLWHVHPDLFTEGFHDPEFERDLSNCGEAAMTL
jgi:hypothetical protein